MQRYLISSHSSIPYFEPSRPMPDSLTPPNGATSVEMKPGVDAEDAVLERLRDTPDAAHVARVEVGGEAVRRVVRRRGPPRSSVEKRAMPATGPNVSSQDIAASAGTPAITVGC